jgi:hypothetical protein
MTMRRTMTRRRRRRARPSTSKAATAAAAARRTTLADEIGGRRLKQSSPPLRTADRSPRRLSQRRTPTPPWRHRAAATVDHVVIFGRWAAVAAARA